MKNEYRAEARALSIIALLFTIFFWPAILAGKYFVTGDSLVYAYPLRLAAWEMIRQGTLPLWTPNILSGYPLLAMAPLGLGYPLTWGYLFLPGHVAEQVYLLAPFLLTPAFIYAFLRTAGRSRTASLLAGLSFTYGGMMSGGMAHNGMFNNAVMWLPLMLIAIERARTGKLSLCVIGFTLAYTLAIMTGLGQGFLYSGVIALGYATFLALSSTTDRWKPLAVCVCGIMLAAGLAAFQILETMHAQRLSIRRELSYQIFSGGSFAPKEFWNSFMAPIYHFNYEVTAYLPLLAAFMALAAVLALRTDFRVLFWLVVAILGAMLMMGDHTPLYKLIYRIPVINLFRIPWRHAFEWTFAVSILSAYGWDEMVKLIRRSSYKKRNDVIGLILLAAVIAAGVIVWKLVTRPILTGVTLWPVGFSENAFVFLKVGYTLLLLFAVWWAWKWMDGRWRSMLLVTSIVIGCFWEQYILGSFWIHRQMNPGSYYTQISPPSRFLQDYPPEQNRIYSSIARGFILDLPRAEPHNISVRRGFHDAAGYEPLMPERYSKAFGSGWSFDTPAFSSPVDRQILSPRWQILDLLNVRFLAEFAAPPESYTEKEGARFSGSDISLDLQPGKTIDLAGSGAPVDSLSLVTTLANSANLAQGEKVARVIIHTGDGRSIERELRAGDDSAEWAHERPDVKANIRHSLARIFDSRPGDDQNSFRSHRYWTVINLGERTIIDRVELSSVTEKASVAVWKATLYDSTGAGAFMLTQRLPDHWHKVYNHDNVQIYENQRVLPRTWLVPQAKVVGADEALSIIRGEREESFNPREIALLELQDKAEVKIPKDNSGIDGQSRIVSYESNRLVIEISADKPSVLVLSEPFYPGWEASIDGRPATVFPANYLLRGVIMPEGKHRVEMQYQAPAAMIGAIVSAPSMLLIGIGLVITRRREYPTHSRRLG